MNSLRHIVNTIGLEEFMNCVLVSHGVRPSMLIQPADYDERTSADKHTARILKGVLRYFPELKQTVIYEGILISKDTYDAKTIRDSKTVGKLLGYPCVDDYEYVHTHKNEPSMGIQIVVNLKPGGDKDRLQLMANICRNDATFAQSVAFAKKAEEILKADPRVGSIVESVVAEKNVIIPVQSLIRKLIANMTLNDDELFEIRNSIFNMGFPNKRLMKYEIDYNNPVHRGILIGLLTYYENNPVSAFYPLQEHPEMGAVNHIMSAWEDELLHVFDSTANAAGGKRRFTRRNRH